MSRLSANMNGMSRFLSRREKHHEKRSSKHSHTKVRPLSPYPSHSSDHLICSVDGSNVEYCVCHRRRRPNCFQYLYQALPSAWSSLVHDGVLFLCKKPPTTELPQTYVDVSTISSSDNLTLQSRQPPTKVPSDLYKVFTNEDQKPADKDVEKKVKMLVQRLQGAGITAIGDEHAQHALVWYPEDLDKAYDLLVLANESFEGEIKDYNPNVAMVGAINRNMVTCYLDALLFAMFARLDSLEAMLYDEFGDEQRKKLAGILRLWVNLLRTGQLIRVDLTKHLQDALAECGWEEAAQIRQQDASEAFTFITGALELPLLTLKMDIYHTGREDKEDDHKFVNERLLEVAIPEPEEVGDAGIALEDCLETYFNNRIEVKRYLQRQNTMTSILTIDKDPEKNQTVHIEAVELSGPDTPMVSTPISLGPPSPLVAQAPAHPSPIRPLQGRRRGDSIFAEKYTPLGKYNEESQFDEKKLLDEILNDSSGGRPRSASLLRKEIMMPAWQFFSLIPWYTDNVPSTDAQVAAHFSAKRPMLGICLKRYMMLPDGTPKRLDTYVDIPLEIGFPSFISDDRMQDEGPLFGNFKLVLQSVVCHRGVSINSGHYVSLIRANKPPSQDRPGSSHSNDEDLADSWLRFDDLANPRVMQVDIQKALREESPYLLFFQVQPINEDLASRGDPPSYAEAQFIKPNGDPSRETLASETSIETEIGGEWEKVSTAETSTPTNVSETVGRSSTSSIRRNSITVDDLSGSVNSLPIRERTDPTTPEDQKASFLSTSRRNSRVWLSGSGNNKSRPGSQSGEGRLSLTLSRLTGRGSKEKLEVADNVPVDDPLIIINEVQSSENGQQKSPVKEKKDTGISRSKSKKEKKEERKRLRSKSREPPVGAAGKGKNKAKERPDRECVVM